MSEIPLLIASQPGIRRDGTRLQNLNYSDGEWVRFNELGNPVKMGGFYSLSSNLSGTSRGLHSASASGVDYIHTGANDDLQLVRIDRRTGQIDLIQRTPDILIPNRNYVWTFDVIFDVIDDSFGNGSWKILAHAAPNLIDIDSKEKGHVFIGDLTDAAPLSPIMEGQPGQEIPFKVSGGLCCVHPFVFYFDNDGRAIWSVSNKPSNVTDTFNTGTNVPAGQARPTGKKIVAGRALMGLGVPGCLMWSLDTLLQVSYVGGGSTWDFNPVAGIEIVSGKSVVEYNGAYYWIGARRFIAFAGGGVRDVPNTFNKNWFFSNLTKGHEGKIFGYSNPAHGEIWWCAPMFGATEPNHAIVLNVVTGNWYDTPLPGAGRTAALSPTSTFYYPAMAEPADTETGLARLWQHEYGHDLVDGANVTAVRSSYTTGDITLLRGEKPSNASVQVVEIEPDFVQSKKMTVSVIGNANARAPTVVGDPVTFDEPGDGMPAETQVVEIRGEHRQLRFKFESNTRGGHYEAGATYAHINATGQRKTA